MQVCTDAYTIESNLFLKISQKHRMHLRNLVVLTVFQVIFDIDPTMDSTYYVIRLLDGNHDLEDFILGNRFYLVMLKIGLVLHLVKGKSCT